MEAVKARITSFFPLPDYHAEPSSLGGAGANVPPELFARILHFVSRDDHRRGVIDRLEKELRASEDSPTPAEWNMYVGEETRKASAAYKLKTCSLVCRYWANQCRRYMFKDTTVFLWSYEDIILFRKYATQGSSGLLRICDLIRALEVKQSYSWPRSVVDLICLPSTQNKLAALRIELGDSPSLPLSKMDTPHWGLANPASIPPTATSYERLEMKGITFPSFSDLAKYLTHFSNTKLFNIRSLMWNGKLAEPIPSQFVKSAIRGREAVKIFASQCTDNLLVCLQAAMLHPDCILRILPVRDQSWATSIMRHICNFYDQVPDFNHEAYGLGSTTYMLETSRHHVYTQHILSFGVESSHPEYPRLQLYFACDSKPLSPRSSRRGAPLNAVRISGVTVFVEEPITEYQRSAKEFKSVIADLGVIRTYIENRCALRVVVFAFLNYALLLAFLEQYPSLREPIQPPDQQTYLFVCARSTQHPFTEVPGWNGNSMSWVTIDHATLQTTGERWQNTLPDIVPELLQRRS